MRVLFLVPGLPLFVMVACLYGLVFQGRGSGIAKFSISRLTVEQLHVLERWLSRFFVRRLLRLPTESACRDDLRS